MNTEHAQCIYFTPEQLQKMAELYRSGMAARNIGKIYGIDDGGVLRRLKMMGVTIRKAGNKNRTNAALPKVLAMRKQGIGWRAISEKFSISESHLQKHLKRYIQEGKA